MKKQPAYEMALPKGRIILLGELSKGDVTFIRKWLNRIEAAQQVHAADLPKAGATDEAIPGVADEIEELWEESASG